MAALLAIIIAIGTALLATTAYMEWIGVLNLFAPTCWFNHSWSPSWFSRFRSPRLQPERVDVRECAGIIHLSVRLGWRLPRLTDRRYPAAGRR
jgi:hypothetical protein